jgi:hypothetical protein
MLLHAISCLGRSTRLAPDQLFQLGRLRPRRAAVAGLKSAVRSSTRQVEIPLDGH